MPTEHNRKITSNILVTSEDCITIKDHKDTFSNKITCVLINPPMPDIGNFSILDRINKSIISWKLIK